MRAHSLVYDNYKHQMIEVEVSLHPGLPGIQILGLPDAVVKDCVWRIKSAFLHSGFQWPTASQVIVNLKPSHLRKRGTGLDLAIAAALLWETGQVERLECGSELPLLYGELDLLGEVHTPTDFVHYTQGPIHPVIVTGHAPKGLPYKCMSISRLRDLVTPQAIPPAGANSTFSRPPLSAFRISKRLAEIVTIVATGEHPTLFAGRAGSGKTTVAQIIHTLLEPPSPKLAQEYNRYHSHNPITWRPFRSPHHTGTALAIIGGGPNVQPGELTRAHGGTLLLDEFLEFDASVQEALREPVERGVIELIRCSKAQTLQARFLLLATTNLCKCGDFEPGLENLCICGLIKRRRYLERLSGPILDRFAMVIFSKECEGAKTESIKNLLEKIIAAHAFRKERGQEVANCYLSADALKAQLSPAAESYLSKELWSSERRVLHLLRVARTIADLAAQDNMSLGHLEAARHLTVENQNKLRRANFGASARVRML